MNQASPIAGNAALADLFEDFLAAYRETNFGLAMAAFDRALDVAPGNAYRYFLIRASAQLAHSVVPTGQGPRLAQRLNDLFAAYPHMHVLSNDDPEDVKKIVALRDDNIAKGLPSVAMITLGKSASVSVGAIFHSGFVLPSVAYSLVNTEVVDSWARDYARGGACYTTHLRPTARNVARLKASGIPKIVVHVRDPRQAMLSAIHHMRRYTDQNSNTVDWETSQLPDQIDTLMETYLGSIGWISGWLGAGTELDIHYSTFEEYVTDEAAFIERYLAYYGAPREHFNLAHATQRQAGTDYHLRRGEIDEWREVFPKDVVARLTSLLPNALAERFGWRP